MFAVTQLYGFMAFTEDELYFVSHPYPLYVLETGLEASASSEGGSSMQLTLDMLDAVASVASGQLASLLQQYSVPVESLDGTASVQSGTLTTILLAYTIPVESLDGTASVQSGTLATILISYLNWPVESLDATAGVTSGTLA